MLMVDTVSPVQKYASRAKITYHQFAGRMRELGGYSEQSIKKVWNGLYMEYDPDSDLYENDTLLSTLRHAAKVLGVELHELLK